MLKNWHKRKTATKKNVSVSAARRPVPPWLHLAEGFVLLDVLVVPRSSKSRVMGVHDGRLKMQLAAPPVDGQANSELVRFLAESLGVAKAQIQIVGGASNRRKTVRVAGVAEHIVVLKLA